MRKRIVSSVVEELEKDSRSKVTTRCAARVPRNGIVSPPGWFIFVRRGGKRPRTVTMETPVEVYRARSAPLNSLSIKGRAWIAADSGQVIHLETNLVGPILSIDLSEIAISVDYAPVRSHSLNVEIWLPQFAVAFTDYAQRRMITEHTFSDFELFSVETRENRETKGAVTGSLSAL
jgi:hypothetical protein